MTPEMQERIESAEINLMAASDAYESEILADLFVTKDNIDAVEAALEKLHEAAVLLGLR